MTSFRNMFKGAGMIILIWWLAYLLGDQRLIPNPWQTLYHTLVLIGQGTLLLHLFFSSLRLIIAVLIALILGISLGVAMGQIRWIRRIFEPLIYFLFPVPKAAFLPLIFLLFGLGNSAKIVLIGLILFFQITVSVYDATCSIDPGYFLTARALKLSNKLLYTRVLLPAILPSVFSALKVSVGIGIAVLFFAETYATNYGLGYFIMNAWFVLDFQSMISGIIMMGLLGYILFLLIDRGARWLMPWRD